MRISVATSATLLLLAAAACGEPQTQNDTGSAPAGGAAAPVASTPDVVRTADPAARGYSDSDFPRVQEVAPGVYTYEALRSFGSDRVSTVSFFVVTDEGVLVADGQGSPEETQALIDHIAQVTTQPIRTVVIGSDHADHTGGNSAFPAGVAFLAHPTSAATLRQRGGVPAVTQTVDDERDLTMGGREIRVLHLGRAHTGGDLMVYVPKERVLFMSEVFMNHVFPSMATAYPSEWVATIQRAQDMGASVYIPGHGFVDPPAVLAEELDAFKGAIQLIIEETRHPHSEGAGVEDAIARVQLGDLDTWSRAASLREVAIRRVYQDLNGELMAR
jgi:glyoxylase-like metal-dependent hydrolase (beta-lactamase superfamily II)